MIGHQRSNSTSDLASS